MACENRSPASRVQHSVLPLWVWEPRGPKIADDIHAPEDLIRAIARRRIVIGATLGISPVPGVSPPPELARRLPAILANLGRLYQAGAPLVAGTDGGTAPVKPHDVLRWALPDLTGIGLTPAGALRSATSPAAAVCGPAHRKGQLAPGYDADILAVDGDPLADLRSVHHIRGVYACGTRVHDQLAHNAQSAAGIPTADFPSASSATK